MSCAVRHPNGVPICDTCLMLVFAIYSSNIAASPHQKAKGTSTSQRFDIPNNLFPLMKFDTCGTLNNDDFLALAGGDRLDRVLN